MQGALAKTRTPARSISRHKFHHQFARSCTRSMTNPMQPFSNHCASARLSTNAFIRGKPYPLSEQGFYGSPTARRKLRGVPRDGHAMAAQHPARQPAKYLASCPLNFPATAGQRQPQCRRMAGRITRKPTCRAPDSDAQYPPGYLRDDSQHDRATTVPQSRQRLARRLAQISTMTSKDYEHANHTNARS